MATIPASENEFPQILMAEVAAPSTPASGLVVCYVKSDGLLYCKDDAGTETAYGASVAGLAAHLADTSDAHDASAISVLDSGAHFTATDVEAALAELFTAISGSGISPTIFDAQGDLIVASAADTAARLALGTSGQALVSNGTTAVWGRPKGTVVDYGTARRTGGDVTCSADQVWTEVDSGLRITLDAAAGDRLEIGLQAICTGTEAVSLNLTAMSFVSAALTNDLFEGAAKSDTTNGVPGWRMASAAVSNGSGAFISPALVSGDISGGTVVVTLAYRTSSNTNRVLRADTTLPLDFWAKNLGPAI